MDARDGGGREHRRRGKLREHPGGGGVGARSGAGAALPACAGDLVVPVRTNLVQFVCDPTGLLAGEQRGLGERVDPLRARPQTGRRQGRRIRTVDR